MNHISLDYKSSLTVQAMNMVYNEKCFLFLRLLFPSCDSNKVVHVILNSD